MNNRPSWLLFIGVCIGFVLAYILLIFGEYSVKSNDYMYLIVENLRYLLAAHSPTDPVYFGCRFKPFLKDGYMSGGAGMVLSKEALIRFVKGLPDPKLCQQEETSLDDVEIGKCLQNVEVHPRDSRDSLGRGRFFPFTPDLHIIPGLVDGTTWYRDYVYYETHEGLEFTISFHYVPSHLMHTFDFFIYHFKLIGYNRNVVF